VLFSGLYPADISTKIQSQIGTVGDIFTYRILVESDDTISAVFPQLTIDNEDVEIVSRREIISLSPFQAGMEFQLRFWNVGEFEIPPYTVLVSSDGEQGAKLTTESVEITITTVIDDKSPVLREMISPVPLPPLISKKESNAGEYLLLKEGGESDTITVYMVNPPEKSITVSIYDENGQLEAEPDELTFNSDNWGDSLSVYISAINEWKEEGDHSGRISFVLLSEDDSDYREIGMLEYRIKDRGPFPYWLAARIAAIIILVGLLIWIWLKKTGRLPTRVHVPIKTPPLNIALKKLKNLDSGDVTSENVKTFYFELSQIIREFLEHEYFIRVLEMTTEEIREVLPQFEGEKEWEESLMNLLERADKVKFAKDEPDPKLLSSDLESGVEVVRQAHREWIIFSDEAALDGV
jgi:hypothetical protein